MGNNKKKLIIDGKNVEKLKINQRKTIENINRVCDEKGITKYKLAQEAHISHPHFYNIVSGRKSISLDHVKRIAECLKVELSELVAYENDYDEGYSDAISSLVDYLNKDYLDFNKSVFDFTDNTDALIKLRHKSFLYPFLRNLGYEIIVEDSAKISEKYQTPYFPPPLYFGEDEEEPIYEMTNLMSYIFSDEVVFLIKKNEVNLCYVSPREYYHLEKSVKCLIDGFFNELTNEFKTDIGYTLNPCFNEPSTNIEPMQKLKKQLSDMKAFVKECEEMIGNVEKYKENVK